MKKAIFFDRDGTLIVDQHYLSKVEKIDYFPFTFEACRILQTMGFELFIVTNQSGIGRGLFTQLEMEAIHLSMQQRMMREGLRPFTEISFCPHLENDNCNCRKPRPGMIEALLKKYQFVANDCFMVGDKESDALAGVAAGVTGILLSSSPHPRFKTYPDIYQFALGLKNC